jgi:hypothetical protein
VFSARTGEDLRSPLLFEIRELRLPPAPRRDYRIVVNLKDIGTLLDVNGSLDALFGR